MWAPPILFLVKDYIESVDRHHRANTFDSLRNLHDFILFLTLNFTRFDFHLRTHPPLRLAPSGALVFVPLTLVI